MFFHAVFVLALLHFSFGEKKAPTEVRVRTKFGDIAGVELTNIDESKYYAFYSVPYAKNPTRFKDAEPWTDQYVNGVWKVAKPKRCIQQVVHSKDIIITGEEDCLFLNVYTTTMEETAHYNVIVFIHGGAFVYGAGHAQTPEYLLQYNKQLVFVSINYRLGPFGFLSTEDDVVTGNMGLKDQVLALRWVKENIHVFGGDPNKVMLAGMSAGAISVHLHYFSPMSRDLFTRGISMSGVALSHLIKTTDIRKGAEYLAVLVRCPIESSEEMVKCLREKPAKEIVESIAKDDIPWKIFNSYYPFGPIVDINSPNPFLNEHPYFLLRSGNMKHAPWLTSATTAEGLKPGGLFIDDDAQIWDLNEHWEEILPYLLMFKHSAPKKKLEKICNDIAQQYLNGQPIAKHNRPQAIKMIGDRLYMTTIEDAVRLHAKASSAPVYFYMFGFRGQQSFSSKWSKTDTDLGASHIDDMIYVLKMNGFDPTKKDETMIKRMVGIWTSFMKEGVPDLSVLRQPWPPVNKNIVIKGKLEYVIILDLINIRTASSMDLSNRNFWERLPLDELHVTGDRRVPPYIKKLRKKESVMARYILNPMRKIKTKVTNMLSKIKRLGKS